MKVLHVYNHFLPCIGGIEKHVEGLCKNLVEMGHQSDVACLNTCSYSKKKLSKYSEYDGIKVYRIPYIDLKFYKIAPGILQLIKRYDIIHVHGLGFFADFLVSTKFIHKKTLIFSTHGGIFHTKRLHIIKMIYFNFWCRFALKKFDKIIAVSKNDAQMFSKVSNNIVLIQNAIKIEEFTNLKRTPEKNSLLYVGRITRNKRLDNLIKTVFFLKKKISDVKLYVIGEDWEGIRKDLEELVNKKGLEDNVIFIGLIRDKNQLLSYFSKANFFVSASEYEGFGISVLEAMALGCTVVLNDIPPFRDFVTHNKNGFITDYSNPYKASDLIFSIMNMDLNQISENAKQTAGEYDWKEIIRRFEVVYNGINTN